MGAYTNNIAWETLRSIDSSTFAGTYAAIGTPLAHPAFKIKMVNNSSVLVTISIDGVKDIDVAPANSYWLYDETLADQQSPVAIPSGTQFYVKGSAGTGLVYLVVQYLVQR